MVSLGRHFCILSNEKVSGRYRKNLRGSVEKYLPRISGTIQSPESVDGAPGETRTPNPLLRRQMLYPVELRAQPEIILQEKFAAIATRYGSHTVEFHYGFTATRFSVQLFPVKQKSLFELATGLKEVWN